MLHDFLITEKYMVIPDLPMEFNIDKAIKNNDFVYALNMEARTRYGFISRRADSSDNMIWIETEPHYCFHFCNAWDETNEQGDEIVVVTGSIHYAVNINLATEHLNVENDPAVQHIEKFLFNLTKKTYIKRTMLGNVKMEFPIINQSVAGYKNRYCYMPHMRH